MGNETSVERGLEGRVALEDLLVTISARFIDLPIEGIDREISRALEAIGEFTGIDRSYLFLFSPDGSFMDNTHEWCAAGIDPQIDSLQRISCSRFPWWTERIFAHETIDIPSVRALPAEAAVEKEILLAQQIRSLVVVPIVATGGALSRNGKPVTQDGKPVSRDGKAVLRHEKAFKRDGAAVGFLGFDSVREEKSWPAASIRLLEKTGIILSRALERRRRETLLRESEERHWLALRGSDVALWDWNVRSGTLFFNRQWAEMLGYVADDLENHVRAWMKRVHPDDFRRFMRALNEHLEGKSGCFEAEYRLGTKEGDWLWVLDRGRVVEKSGDGRALRMAGTRIDTTRRKLAETALRISEKRYRTVVEGLCDPVCRFRPDMTITFVNRAFCRCFEREPEGLIGENLLSLVPEDDRSEVEVFFGCFDRDRTTATIEYRLQPSSGPGRWMQWVNRATFDDAGAIEEFQAVGRDITAWVDRRTP